MRKIMYEKMTKSKENKENSKFLQNPYILL